MVTYLSPLLLSVHEHCPSCSYDVDKYC